MTAYNKQIHPTAGLGAYLGIEHFRSFVLSIENVLLFTAAGDLYRWL